MPSRVKHPIAPPTPREESAVQHDVEGPRFADLASAQTALVDTPAGGIALFAVADAVFAIDGHCIRCGTSLAAGSLHRLIVTCVGCGWRYDISTGQVKNVPALRAHVYDASIVDGSVMVSSTPAAWRPLP